MDDVSKAYKTTTILDKLALGIKEGERVVLLGPSGCGKTTTLRLIAGFVAPDSGTVSIAGESVSRDGQIIKPPEERKVGMVFQDFALWPHLSVKENIEFGLKAKGIAKAKREEQVRKMLVVVDMDGYADRKPAELSGGQQQRTALARALALQPKLLLMDEPLFSLDQELNSRLRREIVLLQEKLGFTMLYVTHNRDEAFAIATRIVMMQKGRLEFDGSVAEAEYRLRQV
ncbi:MAG TPA: ABC transporter ATP-binding protein [Epsilonproteobacteria bacterium]|nr:ABC transporter ATP-binding protein [Campylobacterota bacterium]